MKIKSLLIITAFSLGSSAGYAGQIVPVEISATDHSKLPKAYRDRLHEIAHTSAIISTSSKAAAFAVGNKDGYTHLESIAALSSYLYDLLDATLEGAEGDSIMQIKRFLDVFDGLKVDAGQKNNACITWIKQFDAQQAKELALALGTAVTKEIVFEQSDALVIKKIKGHESSNRMIRRALRVMLATLIESSLDTLQVLASNKLVGTNNDWKETCYDSALKTGLTSLIIQMTGEFIRRGLEGQAKEQAQEKEELNEAAEAANISLATPEVVFVDPAISSENTQITEEGLVELENA